MAGGWRQETRRLYLPHAFRDVLRYVRRSPHRGTQRLRDGPGARRRDAAVRVWRGDPAPDDALRGELCVVGDLLHAFSCRSFSRRDRADPDSGLADARRADAVVWAEGGEETPHASPSARGGARTLPSGDRGG